LPYLIPPAFTWKSQAEQYLNRGEPDGYRYERHYANEHDAPPGAPVDCLLRFDEKGLLVGILNHYPEGGEDDLEQAGNVNLWVRPNRQRQGIATALLIEANRKWHIDINQQKLTPDGVVFLRGLIRKGLLRRDD
jgi:hypothetical protein